MKGIHEYRVLDMSLLAYWGAVRAREIDPRQGEMVAAIVLSEDSLEGALLQATTLLWSDDQIII